MGNSEGRASCRRVRYPFRPDPVKREPAAIGGRDDRGRVPSGGAGTFEGLEAASGSGRLPLRAGDGGSMGKHGMGDGAEAIGRAGASARSYRPVDMLLLAAWCGLAAGELEVAVRVARRFLSSTDRLYMMTRHFVWLVPMLNALLFAALGGLCALAARRWPRRGGWLGVRLILLWSILPSVLLLGRGLYAEARLILAIGLAVCLGPMLERALLGRRRRLAWSFAAMLAAVSIQGGWLAVGDGLGRWREGSRPLPPPGSPSVLLIVLDTVRADHLSAYGYHRPTTPNLEALARRGIRFDRARASAPWTLPSHATLFTGRWPHEVGSRWLHPMRGDVPTLAGHLGSLGHATAGFVGNTFYCGYDSGLDRGFTVYRDHPLDWPSALRTVHLIGLTLRTVRSMAPGGAGADAGGPAGAGPWPAMERLARGEKKDARAINGEFLDWLSRAGASRRPFFAFLNYIDAHAPYTLPAGTPYRFRKGPLSGADYRLLDTAWLRADRAKLPRPARDLAIDAYDSCLASIDDALGELFGELRRRGVLDHTIVIVTSDHGEEFGEHGLFDHGESLYRPEVRVPLLIALPDGQGSGRVVDRFVSLRDIPATIVDLVGGGRPSPFPGRSLARLWRSAPGSEPTIGRADDPILSELSAPNPADPSRGRSPARSGPLISLADGDLVYIRNLRDGKEQLFDEREDPRELTDLSRTEPARGPMRRFRESSSRILGGRPDTPGVSDGRDAPPAHRRGPDAAP